MGENALAAGLTSSLTFVILNVAMNLYMKWLFREDGGNFAFPWTMLAVQQLQAYMVLQPWIAWKFPVRRFGWYIGDEQSGDLDGWTAAGQVLAVTVLFCLNVGLNSLSLVRISITLNQTVRAFLPVGVLLLATIVERRSYDSYAYYTTLVLVLGIALTCWGSPNFEFYGFCLAFASTVVAAIASSLNGRLLSNGPFSKAGSDKIAQLMMFQSVPAFVVFAVVATITEGRKLQAMLEEDGWRWHYWLALVSVSSCLALMANLGRCFLVAATSALMETLAGNAKVAALCIIDNQLFHTALYPYNYAGIALTFGGFSVHVLLSYAKQNKEKQSEPAKTNGADDDTIQRKRTVISLPRVVSGGETGLAAEHLGVRMGKPSPSLRRNRHHALHDGSIQELASAGRQRSATWQAGMDPTRTWFDRMGFDAMGHRFGMDLETVIEPPPWLQNEQELEDATSSVGGAFAGAASPVRSPLDLPTGSRFGNGGDAGYLQLRPTEPVVVSENTRGRARIWSDMTHSQVGNPRAPL